MYKQALQLTAVEKRPEIALKSSTSIDDLDRQDATALGSSNPSGDGWGASEGIGAEAVGVEGSRPEHRRRSFVGVQGDSTCKGELFGLENLLQFEVLLVQSRFCI